MTIQQAIEKAIEGGYEGKILYYFLNLHGKVVDTPINKDVLGTLFLDPLFWKSLGRVMGWGKLHCLNCKSFAEPVRKKESDPEYWLDCCPRKNLDYGKDYKKHWHSIIDHLDKGGTAESFFESLTNHNT